MVSPAIFRVLGLTFSPRYGLLDSVETFFELGTHFVFFILYRFQRHSLTVVCPCPSPRVVSSMYASSFIPPIISVICYNLLPLPHSSLAAHLIHVHNSHSMSSYSSYLNPLCVSCTPSIQLLSPSLFIACSRLHRIMIPLIPCISPIPPNLSSPSAYISCLFLQLSHPCL